MGAKGELWRTLILIMLYTGLRPGDAAHLRYQDFTLEKRVINMPYNKTIIVLRACDNNLAIL
jgi:integrase